MLSLILLAIVSVPLEPLEVRLEKYDKKCQERREKSIASLKDVIASATKAPVTTKAGRDVEQTGKEFRFRTADAKRKHIKLLQDLLKKQVDGLNTGVRDAPLDIDKMEVGDIGLLPDSLDSLQTDVRVFQVIGPMDMIAEFRSYSGQGRPTVRKDHFWVTGVSTEGYVDNKQIELKQLLEVSGTKSYATAGNTKRTIFMLSPVPMK